MAILNYISIKEVIAKIYRDLNIEQEERWVDMVEWCGEALQKIGAHSQYIEAMEVLPVVNYRASLPCNIHKIIQVEINGKAAISGTGSFDGQNQDPTRKSNGFNNSYTINDAYINTTFETGEVGLAYIAIPIDAEGFPLIPNDEGYKEAMLKYVVMKLKYADYITGRFPLYKELEVDWHKYCAQARGNANMPSLDTMESIKNQWVKLMPQMQRHKAFFSKLNNAERIAGNRLPHTNRN
jgi:hypothetical protein